MKMKKLISLLLAAILVMATMTGCSTSTNLGRSRSRSSIELVKSTSDYNEYRIDIGDTLTSIGVGNGSTIRARVDSHNGVTLSFDLRVTLTQKTKDQVVEGIEELLRPYVGEDYKISASSLEVLTNETRLKFDVNFKL